MNRTREWSRQWRSTKMCKKKWKSTINVKLERWLAGKESYYVRKVDNVCKPWPTTSFTVCVNVHLLILFPLRITLLSHLTLCPSSFTIRLADSALYTECRGPRCHQNTFTNFGSASTLQPYDLPEGEPTYDQNVRKLCWVRFEYKSQTKNRLLSHRSFLDENWKSPKLSKN